MKSTNSGATWSVTGLTWNINMQRIISRLIINPSNPDILLAATSSGIYRTLDAGTTWLSVKTGNFKDMEFMPGNPNVIYVVSGSQCFKSTYVGTTSGAALTVSGLT